MKKIFTFLAIALLLVVGIVLFNTFRIESKQLLGLKPAPSETYGDSAVAHLQEAIRYRTVSYQDLNLMDSTQFEKFVQFVEKSYPLIHSRLKRERLGGFSLLYEWKGSDATLKPAMLMGHYDVVPMIQGTEKMWKHRPFSGDLAEGYIYGRGTLDDKVTVISILEAVEFLLQNNYQPTRTFLLSFGHDEEVSGPYGAQFVAKQLENRKIQAEYIIDEGGAIKADGVPGVNKPIALLGVAEKGYLTLQLTSVGEGGHSSMPPEKTAIGMLSEAIDRLQKNPFPARIGGAASYMQDYLAPEMPFTNRMAIANRWLFGSIIKSSLAKSPSGNAMMRTTIAPTVIDGGVKENVLPIEATAKINFRILPGDSVKGVIAHVKNAIGNDKIKVESISIVDSEPSAVSDTATYGFRTIHRVIKSCFPDVTVTPYLVMAATDSRFFSKISPNIYRFMPVRLNEEDLKRPHGTNERIRVTDYQDVIKFYVNLIRESR